MQSSVVGAQATIQKNTGNVTVNYVSLKDLNATGGALFTANNAVDLGNNTGWIINGASPLNLYWVGGTGNWNYSLHWSFTSGGAGGACLPTAIDNVYFDANSFTAPNQTVTINVINAVCNDMDWTGVTNNPTLTGPSSYPLRIYGSITFVPSMNLSFAGCVYFEATSTGKTITMAGNQFNNNVYFQGICGGWTFLDPFILDGFEDYIYFIHGNLNTNGNELKCSSFYSQSPNTRSLNISNSIITIQNTYICGWSVSGTNLTLSATGSLIKFDASCAYTSGFNNSGGNLLIYNYVEFYDA